MASYTELALKRLQGVWKLIEEGSIIHSNDGRTITVLDFVAAEEFRVLVYANGSSKVQEPLEFSAVIMDLENWDITVLHPPDHDFFSHPLKVGCNFDQASLEKYLTLTKKVDLNSLVKTKALHDTIYIENEGEMLSFQFLADIHLHQERIVRFWEKMTSLSAKEPQSCNDTNLQKTDLYLLLIKNFLDYSKITPIP